MWAPVSHLVRTRAGRVRHTRPPHPIEPLSIMLINCVAYQNGAKLRDIPVAEISDFVSRPDCFVWVALFDPSPAEIKLMQEEFDLHELAVEDSSHGGQRPKVEEYGDVLFSVMHLPSFDQGELVVGELDVFAGPNFVLSMRQRDKQGFLGVRARCERSPELLQQGSGFVFYALIDAVVDRYFPILVELESQLDQIENRIFTQASTRDNIRALYELKGRVQVLKHAVSPLHEAVGKLVGGRVPPVCAKSGEYFRDVQDHLTRLNISVDSMRDTITTAIQVSLSMVAIEESEVNKRLAAWAGIFAAATAFAGIWGMNFKGMPELDWPYGYPLALAVIASTCSFLYYRFRKAGWL